MNDIQAYVNSYDAQGSKKEAEERNTFNERWWTNKQYHGKIQNWCFFSKPLHSIWAFPTFLPCFCQWPISSFGHTLRSPSHHNRWVPTEYVKLDLAIDKWKWVLIWENELKFKYLMLFRHICFFWHSYICSKMKRIVFINHRVSLFPFQNKKLWFIQSDLWFSFFAEEIGLSNAPESKSGQRQSKVLISICQVHEKDNHSALRRSF